MILPLRERGNAGAARQRPAVQEKKEKASGETYSRGGENYSICYLAGSLPRICVKNASKASRCCSWGDPDGKKGRQLISTKKQRIS